MIDTGIPASTAAVEAAEQERAALFHAVDARVDRREAARRRLNRQHGADLLLVRQQALWRYGDFDGLDAYIASKHWSRSAAYQWMDAAAAADRLLHPDPPHRDAPAPAPHASEDDLDRIGVGNLAQLGRALSNTEPEAVAELVAQAQELTTSDFRRLVQERAGKAASVRAEFLEDVALSLRDMSTALPVSPDARGTLQAIVSRAQRADSYLAELDQGWATCQECGGTRNSAGACTECGVIVSEAPGQQAAR